MGTTELTITERTTLAALEDQIKRSMSGFIEAGGALLQIRDERLYRDEHETFETYCRDRWLIGRNYANRLIESAKVVQDLVPASTQLSPVTETLVPIGTKVSPATETLSPIGDIPETLPTHESQVRELAKAPAGKRAAVWRAAVAAAPKDKATGKPKVTAAGVKAAAEKVGGVKPRPKRSPKETGAAPVQPAPGSKGIDPEKLAPAANLATPAGDAPEIDELEAATRDAPADADPSQPWAPYNAVLDRAIEHLRAAKGLIVGLASSEFKDSFAQWIDVATQAAYYDDVISSVDGQGVSNWGDRKHAAKFGRPFMYRHERGGKAGKGKKRGAA